MKTFLSFLFIFSVAFLSAFQSHDSKDYEKAMKEMKNNGTPVVAVYIKNPKYIPPVKKYLLENKKFMEQNGKKFNFLFIDIVRLGEWSYSDTISFFHKDSGHNQFFELETLDPKNYEKLINTYTKPIPDEIKYSYYPHGDIRKFYEKVKKGELSYHVTNRDGTHIFHYHLQHYFRGLFIPDEIMFDMIRELRKKNHPKEFWSKALMLHTYNLDSYYREKPGERSIDSWLKIADLLLEAGADPNYADDHGHSTAYMLFRHTSKKWNKTREAEPFFQKLVSAGLDINRSYPNKCYPEQGFAIRRNNKEYLDIPIPAEGGHPWLLNRKFFSWSDKLYLIKKWKMDINAGGGFLLKDVIANFKIHYNREGKTRLELVEELLKLGADPNARKDAEAKTPFLFVCQHLHRQDMMDIFHLMLKYGANPNLTWVYTDKHSEQFIKNAYSTIPHHKLNALGEYINALLEKGIKPESIDIDAAMGKRDEDLAISILERGGICKTFDSYDKRRFPRLAEYVKNLPPSRIKPDPPSKGGWQRDYAVMKPQGSPAEKAVLQRAADLLIKYTDFRSNQRFYFSSSYSLDMILYPGAPAPNFRDWIVDSSFFLNAVYAETPDEKEIACIKTALAMTDWSLEIIYGIVYGFPKVSTRGRNYDLIELKEKTIYGLQVNLKTAAEFYVYLPKHNQVALDYLPDHTAAFLKSKLDAIPKDAAKKDKDKAIVKIIGEVLTFYWRGKAPEDLEGLQREIDSYWSKTYAVIEEELVRISKMKKKPFVYPQKFMKGSIVKNYISHGDLINMKFNRTHKKPVYETLDEKIQHYKDSFTGSKEAKKNFAKLLDIMQELPTAQKLLENMPDDLRFFAGSFGKMGARYSYHRQIGIFGLRLDAADEKSGKTEYQLSLINDLVHEMTHCEQQMSGLKNFHAADNRENMIYHKLAEIHPQINSYLALRDLLELPEYKKTAEKVIMNYAILAHTFYEKYYDSSSPTLWRNEFVKALITNGRGNQNDKFIRNLILGWFNIYQKQFSFFMKNKDGISFEKLIEKYEEMMETDLGLSFYQDADPFSKN